MKHEVKYSEYHKEQISKGAIPLTYVGWLEYLVSNSIVVIEVSGGVADLDWRSSRHIWVTINDYDNREDRDGNPQPCSEEVWIGW